MSRGESVTRAHRIIGGRYELEALIGRGGIGEVWRARHLALNSHVAVKFLQLASAERASAKRRFTTEAQVTAQLKTPNAVQVFDFGVTEEGHPYLVMELLEGETLGRRLERRVRLAPAETARLLGQAARALHRAHQLGIVHRDFKPDNVVIFADDEGRDQVKVLDFGVAKIVGALDAAIEPNPPGEGDGSFTHTGAVLGTPLYMAPEQIRNSAQVDLRTDIWALGVVAFECLTGRTPFSGETLEQLFERVVAGAHPLARFLLDELPVAFDEWFDVACALEPARRFPNASVAWQELAVALGVRALVEPPLEGRSPSNGSDRPVVLVSSTDTPDSEAPTLDARSPTPAAIVRRTHGEQLGSLRRIPLQPQPAGGAGGPRSPASPLAQSIAEEPPRRAARGRWWVAGALGLAAATLWLSRMGLGHGPGMADAPARDFSAAVTTTSPPAVTAAPSPVPSEARASRTPLDAAASPAPVAPTWRAPTRPLTSRPLPATASMAAPSAPGPASDVPAPSTSPDPASYR